MNLYQVWFCDNGKVFMLFGTYADEQVARQRARNISLASQFVYVTSVAIVANYSTETRKRCEFTAPDDPRHSAPGQQCTRYAHPETVPHCFDGSVQP